VRKRRGKSRKVEVLDKGDWPQKVWKKAKKKKKKEEEEDKRNT